MFIPCQLNQTMSAHTALEGTFKFNKNALAAPGRKVLVHDKPQQSKTWGIYGIPGWSIGPAMDHYRYYTSYTANTRGERHAYVVEFLPQHLIMTGLSTNEPATKAAKELVQIMKNPGPTPPFTI